MTVLDLHEELSALGALFAENSGLEDTLRTVADTSVRVVPGATSASLTLWQEHGPFTLATTSAAALAIDQSQYDAMTGPCVDAARHRRIYAVADTAVDDRWPSFAAAAHEEGVTSSLSIPLLAGEETVGSLNVYGDRPFGTGARDIAVQVASAGSIVTLGTTALQDQARRMSWDLEAALRSRTTIDRAIGILMADQRLTQDAAFATLVKLSQTSNRKLRDLASALVKQYDETATATATAT